MARRSGVLSACRTRPRGRARTLGIAGVGGTERDLFELYFIEGFEPDEIAMNLPDEILAALEFSALGSKAFFRIDELAYRTGRRSKHG